MFWLLLGACDGTATTSPPATVGQTDPSEVTDTDLPEETTSSDPTGTTVPPVTTTSGCTPVGPGTTAAIVTDIDETLTTLDSEWLTEIVDPTHDPEMRPMANAVMQQWEDLGYRVFYVTARGEGIPLLDGTSARDATEGWLDAHQFPYWSSDVFLAPGVGALVGTADYKIGVIQDLQAQGFEFAYAYGNADTDIEAYKAVGIPDDHIFLVGKLAGQFGVEPIPTPDAYLAHYQDFVLNEGCAP